MKPLQVMVSNRFSDIGVDVREQCRCNHLRYSSKGI